MSTYTVMGQEEEKVPRRFFFGGNFNLMVGTITNINISPEVGYRITPRLSAGVGLIYEFYRERINDTIVFKTHMYGERNFISFDVIKNLNEFIGLQSNGSIFAYTEYEALNWKYYGDNKRFWLNNVYVGGGLRLPMGETSFFNILVLWNTNQTYDSPFTNPIFRFGFYF
jgi:hypothetical protein